MSATLRLPKYVAELGAVCEDHGRYALAGINFKIDDTGNAKACVTDGKILVEITLPGAIDIGGAMSVVLDPKLLKAALKACHSKSHDPSVRLDPDKGATVTGNGAEVTVPMIDGTFPDYEDVIPSEVSTTIGNESIDIAGTLLAKLSTVLFRACGGVKATDARMSWAFHGPKNPVRVDYIEAELEGRGVIMPMGKRKS